MSSSKQYAFPMPPLGVAMNRAGQLRRYGAAADGEQKKLVVLADEIERLRPAAESWESYVAAQERKGQPVETTDRRCHCGKFAMHADMALITDTHGHDHVFDGMACDCEDEPTCSAVEPKAGILLYKCGKCGTPMRCGPTQWEYQCECNTEKATGEQS